MEHPQLLVLDEPTNHLDQFRGLGFRGLGFLV